MMRCVQVTRIPEVEMASEERIRSVLSHLVSEREVTLLETRPLYRLHMDEDFHPLPPEPTADPANLRSWVEFEAEWKDACETLEAAEWLRERGLAAERRSLEFQIPSTVDPFSNTLIVSALMVGAEDDAGESLREDLVEYARRRGVVAEWDRPPWTTFVLTRLGEESLQKQQDLNGFKVLGKLLVNVTSKFQRDPTNHFAAAYDQEAAMDLLKEFSSQAAWFEVRRDEHDADWLQVLDRSVDSGFVVERLTYRAGKEAQTVERTGPSCRQQSELAIARWSGECRVGRAKESTAREYRLSESGVDVANCFRRAGDSGNHWEQNYWTIRAADVWNDHIQHSATPRVVFVERQSASPPEPGYLGLIVDERSGTVSRDGSNGRIDFEVDSLEFKAFLAAYHAGARGATWEEWQAAYGTMHESDFKNSGARRSVKARVSGKLSGAFGLRLERRVPPKIIKVTT